MATKTEIDMIFTAANEKIRDLALGINHSSRWDYKTAAWIAREFRDWSILMSGNKDFRDLPDNPED